MRTLRRHKRSVLRKRATASKGKGKRGHKRKSPAPEAGSSVPKDKVARMSEMLASMCDGHALQLKVSLDYETPTVLIEVAVSNWSMTLEYA